MNMRHKFDLQAAVNMALTASGLTVKAYAEKYRVSKPVLESIRSGSRGVDYIKVATLEAVLASFGCSLMDYEPRLTMVPAAAKEIRKAIDSGIPYNVVAEFLGFASGSSMARSLNCVEEGTPKESGINGLMLMLTALEKRFPKKCEKWLKDPHDDAPAEEEDSGLAPEDLKLRDRLVKIGKNYGFDKGELEAAFVPEDGRLVWFSDAKLYRFELSVDGFTAYWTPTGRVSVERKFGRLYKDADKRGTAAAAGGL